MTEEDKALVRQCPNQPDSWRVMREIVLHSNVLLLRYVKNLEF